MITVTINSSEDSLYSRVSARAYTLQPPIPSGGGRVTPRSHENLHCGYRNINRFVIGFPFRVRLRSRLTLVRLAFSRKPWVVGERVSTRFVVTHAYIFFSRRSRGTSRSSFDADWNAPLPLLKESFASAAVLMPVNYPRVIARLVSCYALFK